MLIDSCTNLVVALSILGGVPPVLTKLPTLQAAPSVAVDVVIDSEPVLTEPVLAQMTTFWTRFMQLPDSLRTAVMRVNMDNNSKPAWGPKDMSIPDYSKAAATYPEVNTALQQAGLTAPQWNADYMELYSALQTMSGVNLQ